MGLDATVMCNCFRDGKTTTPPFPPEWLEVDDEGYISFKEEHESNGNWGKLSEWEQSCCEHEGMDFVSEHISNWGGYRQFQATLDKVGRQFFPMLTQDLPNANGGLTSAEASAQALVELDVFSAADEIGTKTVLVNTVSGEGLYEYIAAYDGIFFYAGNHGINLGLSEFEFFAIDTTSGAVVFRSKHFRQFNMNGENVSEDCDKVVWEDLDTGKVYESGIAINENQIPFEYPSEFHVELRPRLVTDFDYIVKALRTVFAASVQTGNPVRWC